MFFIFSKILSFLLTPLVWISGLFLFSIFSKNVSRKKKTCVAGMISFIFFSNTFILDECLRSWEVPAVAESGIGTVDAGIVLGGILSYDPQLDRLQFYRSNDRLLQAISLYKKGIIKKIFFIGGSGYISKPWEKEGIYVNRFLAELGIPKGDIIIESESRNTHENAQKAKVIIEKNFPNGKFLLITSAMHMRRATKCFTKENIQLSSYSTDRYSGPRKFDADHLFIPSSKTLAVWDEFLHEMSGFVIYKLMGFL